jgi:HAD superfamily hydrolase (TIGR01490 family)
MISFFLKNRKEEEFKQIAKNYSLNSIEKIINEDTYKELSKHLHSGSRVVVVSASMECWLKPWCDQQNIELISTRLEFKNNRVSGKFSTKNCHGKEKVERIKKDIKLEDYKEIYAYGDSNGDKPMLDLATHAFWITR